MKRFLKILTIILYIFTCQVSHGQSPSDTVAVSMQKSITNGVDLEMASRRHSVMSDIRYDVSFDLPSSAQDSVCGEIIISFDYSGGRDGILPIDFKGDPGSLHSLAVNGHTLPPDIVNEHVVVPASLLKSEDNVVEMSFKSSEKGINRRDGYVYTLFVPDRARCVFPCFDQPDMKASFSLSLSLPAEWKAVSNSYQTEETFIAGDRKIIRFAPTEPLSTYLFAFAAGDFVKADYEKGGRKISAYHRETDPARIAQLDDIFRDVVRSLEWQENHTDISYPFSKYDLVILPGFQFGGMEHTGATFYSDKSLFLSENPTPDEYLRRSSLIAHETSHMWFGDLVTMRWFDDVWTKEVFANYYAARITRELLPEFDHDIEWLRDYTASAMSEDRSEGRTPIRQELDNLENAGLIYNDIIYNKAPVMLTKLVDLMGEEAYRDGIREYLSKYSYANADWDELVEILSRHSDKDVKGFSRVWVYEKGMPLISSSLRDGKLIITQSDPSGKGNVWPQRFEVSLINGDKSDVFEVDFTNSSMNIFNLGNAGNDNATIFPNSDGKGYGRFATSETNTSRLLDLFSRPGKLSPLSEMSLMMSLYENYLAGDIRAEDWIEACVARLPAEEDPQMASSLADYITVPLWNISSQDQREIAEKKLWGIASSHPIGSCRTALYRMLSANAISSEICDSIYAVWETGKSDCLSEKDFMNMSYQLAVRYPAKAADILSKQRSRLSNPDRIAEFDFVSRAAVADSSQRWDLFESLKEPSNRRIEPWTANVLSLLFHPLREEEAMPHLTSALLMLPDVKLHGDIFYPAKWSKAVLKGMRSAESMKIVKEVIDNDSIKDSLLRNKILNAICPVYGFIDKQL